MKFKNMKFVVRDEDHSRQIQEALFAAGYSWSGDRHVHYLSSSYLYSDTWGFIQPGTITEFFDADTCKLSTLSDLFNPSKEEPTINIGGNLYLVSDVEYALKNLKKIGE